MPTETTLAAVLHEDPRRVSVEPRHLEAPGPEEALIETHAVGICHSDLGLIAGDIDNWMDVTYPVVFGHEWSGEVLAVGAEVTRVGVGDRVTGCGDLGSNHWFGMTSDGALAERFTVPEALLHRLPEGMDHERGALVEPFACVYQGVRAIGLADPGDLVCVVGAGTVGFCALAIAKALGAATLVVEPDPGRRDLALRLGADHVLDPTASPDVAGAASELTGGRAADLVIESAGAAPALASALELSAQDGRVLFLGLCSEPLIPAALLLIQQRNLRIAGSTGAPPSIWEPALRFLDGSGIDLTPIVTAHYPLAEVPAALEAARDTTANIKVQVDVASG